jgi:hypothetical protein
MIGKKFKEKSASDTKNVVGADVECEQKNIAGKGSGIGVAA